MRFVLVLLAMLMLTGCGSLEKSAYGDTSTDYTVHPAQPADWSAALETEQAAPIVFRSIPLEYPVGIDEITFSMYYYGEDMKNAPVYTDDWILEVRKENVWYVIPLKNDAETSGNLQSLGTEEETFSIDLSRFDYRFGAGLYRLLKQFDSVTYAANFSISWENNRYGGFLEEIFG